MNNLFQFFDLFYLKAQADIAVNSVKMELPLKMQHKIRSTFNFLVRVTKAFNSDEYSQFVLNMFRDPKTKSCDPKWGRDP